jgi:trimeric autotransporter adhesin
MKTTIIKRTAVAVIIQIAAVLFAANSHAQNTFPVNGSAGVGTNTPNASSILEVKSTTKGFLPPRMTKTQRDAIASPVQGLLIYQTDNTKGMYQYDGSAWKAVTTATSNPVRGLNDNLFIGQNAGTANTTGKANIALGKGALKTNVSPSNNIAIGDSTLYNSGGANVPLGQAVNNIAIGTGVLHSNIAGSHNIGVGFEALYTNNGYSNIGIGSQALRNNTTGEDNVAIGFFSLKNNTTGLYNTAIGHLTLSDNTANSNTALGAYALRSNTTGKENTAVGRDALKDNLTGFNNVAIGYNSMADLTSGYGNVAMGNNTLSYGKDVSANAAFGSGAIASLKLGGSNVGIGSSALYSTDTATFNVAVGTSEMNAFKKGDNNIGIGNNAGKNLIEGNNNIFIGVQSKTTLNNKTLSNAVAIGNNATVTQSNTMILGDTANTAFKIGVGTTVPIAQLEAKTSLTMAVKGTCTSNNGNGTVGEANVGTSAYGIWGKSSSGFAGYFAGNVVYTGTFTQGSDMKLKENIKPLENVLDKVMKLDVKTYNYKSEYSRMNLAKGNQIGYIAQNVETVFPTLVIDAYDKSSEESPIEYKSVNYIGMIPVLTKALQEQQGLLTEKDSQIAELKSEIEIIKQKLGLSTGAVKEADEQKRQALKGDVTGFHIMPNPAKNSFTIVSSSVSEKMLTSKIIDASGAEVLSQQLTSVTTDIDITSLTPGIYYVRLMDDINIIKTEKLIVSK